MTHFCYYKPKGETNMEKYLTFYDYQKNVLYDVIAGYNPKTGKYDQIIYHTVTDIESGLPPAVQIDPTVAMRYLKTKLNNVEINNNNGDDTNE